jgi:hypothetical protein
LSGSVSVALLFPLLLPDESLGLLNAQAEAAVKDITPAASKAVAANRTRINRSIVNPITSHPRGISGEVSGAIIIGVAAARRGRSGLGWLFASLLLSPLIAAILLALLPDRRYEEVVHQLALRNAAAEDPRLTTQGK